MNPDTDAETLFNFCKDGDLLSLDRFVQSYIQTNKAETLERILNTPQTAQTFTPLMIAVIKNQIQIVKYLIEHSNEANPNSHRFKLDIYIQTPSGGTAMDYAITPDIGELLDREAQRRGRLKNPHTTIVGYHETNQQSFDYIQADHRQNRYPMIGGMGGYFGGGIYFAFKARECNMKSVHRQYGFKALVRLGNSKILSTVDEYQDFHRVICQNQEPFNLPTDVMQKRLLEHGFDSVYAKQYIADPSIGINYIMNSGEEMVVYSADQVELTDTFEIQYALNRVIPTNKILTIQWINNATRRSQFMNLFTEAEYKNQSLLLHGLYMIGVLP